MTHPLSKLQKEAQALRMTSDEKSALHAVLIERINASQNPIAAAPRSAPGLFYFFTPQLMGSFAAVLVIVVGVGTAYAAQGALPGEPLYAVKTKVTEPLQGALAFSLEDKIKFHTEVAQARIEEAEVLASQNKLDASATAQLESNIDTHLNERAQLLAQLDEKDPGAGGSIAPQLTSSITAHSDVLAELGVESSSSTTQQNSEALASKVRLAYAGVQASVEPMAMSLKMAAPPQEQHAPVAMSFTAQSNEEIASNTATGTASQEETAQDSNKQGPKDSRFKKQALSLELRATSTLATLTKKVQEVQGSMDKDTQAKLSLRVAHIASLVASGEAALSEEDYEGAKDAFTDALNREVTLSTFIEANLKFDNNILKGLLGSGQDMGDDEAE